MNDKEMITCPEDELQMTRLRAIMHRLRGPGGCPWDAEQTHESLISNMIEEAFEAVDTIRKGDKEHLKEELGDVLLQVVFHSELAEEAGDFNFDDVAREVSDKLVRRHPHVYGNNEITSTEGVLSQWDAIKKAEKKGQIEQGYLSKVGEGLPPLMRAAKIQKKAAKVGFDWEKPEDVLTKIEEELAEVKVEMRQQKDAEPSEALKNEIGDLFFAVANLARKLKLNPEELVDRTNLKFVNRFHEVEKALANQDLSLEGASIEQMEQAWQDAK